MAFATNTSGAHSALYMDISHAIYAMMERARDFRAYRRTLAELSELTNAELNDLGLNRSTIRSAAIEAVYG